VIPRLALGLAVWLVVLLPINSGIVPPSIARSGDPCAQSQSANRSVHGWFDHLLCQIPLLVPSGRDLGLVQFVVLGEGPLALEDEQPPRLRNGGLYEIEIEHEYWRSSEGAIDYLAADAALYLSTTTGLRVMRLGGDGDDADLFLMPGDRVLGFVECLAPIAAKEPPAERHQLWWLRKALIIDPEGYVVISEVAVAKPTDDGYQDPPEFGVGPQDIRHFSEPVAAGEVAGLIEQATSLLEVECEAARAASGGVD
jgi:hypothetical protein